MPDSRNNRPVVRVRRHSALLAAFAFLALGTALVAANARAQGRSGPLILAPSVETAPADTSRPAAPAETGSGAAVPIGVSGGRVQIGNLENIDPDTAGVLTVESGGFNIDMWHGTSRPLVDALLPKLPVDASSPAMRDLMRRVLLTVAALPEGKGKQGAFVTERLRLLAAMGDFSGVGNLINATPGRQSNKDLARIEVDSRLLANDIARACSLASAQIVERSEPYWQKIFVFCQALAGEHSKASLGVELLREVGSEDTVFFGMIDALARGGTMKLDSLPQPEPLHLAMARASKMTLPADVIGSNRPGTLRTIAVSPNAPITVRLEAAERAEVAGALPVDTLRQLYTSVQFTAEDMAEPLTRAASYEGAMSRALLYRTALLQTVPTAQAETMKRALDLARSAGRYASTVRAFLPVLARIPASSELAWFAPEALRAMVVAGDFEGAGPWFQLLRAGASSGGAAAKGLEGLMPLLRVAAFPGAGDWGVANLPAWWESAKGEPGAVRRARLLFNLMDIFYGPVPGEVWVPLALEAEASQPVALPPMSLMRSLDGASRGARVGETVVLAMGILGTGGVAGAPAEVIDPVLRALWQIGLERDVRALAVEAMVAAGF